MESIVNRLTEIEDAASAIVQHAEDQREALNKEYDEKRRKFDEELEKKTQARIKAIQEKLEKNTSQLLDDQSGTSDAVIQALQKENMSPVEKKALHYGVNALLHTTDERS